MPFDFSLEPGRKLLDRYVVDYTEKPLISVITPFYNAGATIEQTYRCVMNQTFPYFEWIIVNDGSSNEKDVRKAEELAATDARIRLLHKDNGGISTARNRGIKNANAAIVMPLDADDLIDPTFLEVMYWALETNPDAAWSYGGIVAFEGNEYFWSKPFNSKWEKEENILIGTCPMRREDFWDAGGYFDHLKHYNEDWHLWFRMLAKRKKPVQLTNYYGFWYRIKNDGVLAITKSDPEIKRKNAEELRKWAELVPDDIVSIRSQGLRLKEFPAPKVPEWDKQLNFKTDRPRLMMLLPWLVMGGADKFNLDMVAELSKNYEISILTTLPYALQESWRQRFEEYAIDTFDLAHFLSVDDYAEFIHYFIKSRGIDILFLSCSYYGYYLLPWLRREFPDLAITDYYHSDSMYWRRGGYGRTTVSFDDIIEKTYVGDDNLRDLKIEKGDKSSDKIQTIYIGVDERHFILEASNGTIMRRNLGISDDRPTILYLARLEPEKRPLMMLEIADVVRERIPDVAFIVVGEGSQADEVKKKHERLRLEKTVYFAGYQKEARDCYASADLTLLCSLKEGLALVAYESLAMGKPIVSPYAGGQSCLIDDSVGRLIPVMQDEEKDLYSTTFHPQEVQLYAEAVCAILSDKDLYLAMCKNCRERIEKGFTKQRMADALDAEFTAIMNGRGQDDRKRVAEACRMLKNEIDDHLALYCEWEYPKYVSPVADLDINTLNATLTVDKAQYDCIKQELDAVMASRSWRFMKKLQHVADTIKHGKILKSFIRMSRRYYLGNQT